MLKENWFSSLIFLEFYGQFCSIGPVSAEAVCLALLCFNPEAETIKKALLEVYPVHNTEIGLHSLSMTFLTGSFMLRARVL